MARDKSGYMSVNLGEAPDPVAPNFGLVEQAGAHRGNAAKIAGESDARSLNFLGEMGSLAYQTYQYTQAAGEAKDTMSKLFSPETGWVGEEAYKTGTAVPGQANQLMAEGMDDSRAAFKQVADAAKQDVFTPQQAQARMAALMRERISANPGAAASIRKAYQEFSGQGDWDIKEMQAAFDKNSMGAKAAEEAQKRIFKMAESVGIGFRTITNEKGEVVSALTVDDIAQGIATRQGPGWDAYLKNAMHERQKLSLEAVDTADKTGKIEAGQKTLALKNILDMSVDTVFNTARIEMSGTLWEGKSADEIVGGMGAYRLKIENGLNQSFAEAQQRAMGMPPVEQSIMLEKIAKAREEAEKRLNAMTKDRDSYLATIEFFKRNANLDANTLATQAKTFDQMIGYGFTPNEINRMKTPEGRKQIEHEYRNDPTNPLVLASRQYEQLRIAMASNDPNAYGEVANEASRMKRINSIAAAIVGGKSVVDGAPIDKNTPEAVAAVKLVEERAKEATKKPAVDIKDPEANLLRANVKDMSDKESTVDSYLSFFKSGKLDAMKKEDADYIKTNVANRMQQWLMGEEQVHYPARIKLALKSGKVSVDDQGNLTIDAKGMGGWQQAGDAARIVTRANKMLDLASAASGVDKRELAKQVAEKTNGYTVAKQGKDFSVSFTEEDIMQMGPETAKATLRKMGVPDKYIGDIVADMQKTKAPPKPAEQPKPSISVPWGQVKNAS